MTLLRNLLFIVVHPVGSDINRHTLLQTRRLISLLDYGNIQVQSVSAVHLVAHDTNHSQVYIAQQPAVTVMQYWKLKRTTLSYP